MANFVVKKDGTKAPFDSGKIKNSIAAACQDAALPEERKNQVIEQVSAAVIQMAAAKEEVSTSELKENILGQLDSVEPSASAAWRKYDQEKKAV
ncbi:hypothetical protein CO006_02155 [Candidatus Roizmanbacteria bacterium CG_4_8_14_3_um_filter_35_14]|nr:MAG: hypothetical protein CO006_02155 [Candidatus Roizmanbacteria bacterium CG_4_8_14_3_um_filter_35_14]